MVNPTRETERDEFHQEKTPAAATERQVEQAIQAFLKKDGTAIISGKILERRFMALREEMAKAGSGAEKVYPSSEMVLAALRKEAFEQLFTQARDKLPSIDVKMLRRAVNEAVLYGYNSRTYRDKQGLDGMLRYSHLLRDPKVGVGSYHNQSRVDELLDGLENEVPERIPVSVVTTQRLSAAAATPDSGYRDVELVPPAPPSRPFTPPQLPDGPTTKDFTDFVRMHLMHHDLRRDLSKEGNALLDEAVAGYIAIRNQNNHAQLALAKKQYPELAASIDTWRTQQKSPDDLRRFMRRCLPLLSNENATQAEAFFPGMHLIGLSMESAISGSYAAFGVLEERADHVERVKAEYKDGGYEFNFRGREYRINTRSDRFNEETNLFIHFFLDKEDKPMAIASLGVSEKDGKLISNHTRCIWPYRSISIELMEAAKSKNIPEQFLAARPTSKFGQDIAAAYATYDRDAFRSVVVEALRGQYSVPATTPNAYETVSQMTGMIRTGDDAFEIAPNTEGGINGRWTTSWDSYYVRNMATGEMLSSYKLSPGALKDLYRSIQSSGFKKAFRL